MPAAGRITEDNCKCFGQTQRPSAVDTLADPPNSSFLHLTLPHIHSEKRYSLKAPRHKELKSQAGIWTDYSNSAGSRPMQLWMLRARASWPWCCAWLFCQAAEVLLESYVTFRPFMEARSAAQLQRKACTNLHAFNAKSYTMLEAICVTQRVRTGSLKMSQVAWCLDCNCPFVFWGA